MAKKAKSKVNYLRGFVEDNKGNPIEDQHDAWKEDADCGCGIDCCERKIVMTDKVTHEHTCMYFEDGSLIIEVGGVKFSATLTQI